AETGIVKRLCHRVLAAQFLVRTPTAHCIGVSSWGNPHDLLEHAMKVVRTKTGGSCKRFETRRLRRALYLPAGSRDQLGVLCVQRWPVRPATLAGTKARPFR